MSVTDISRRGTSTILGTIIFVGIMMTAVIPMLLVMNQADTIHEMRKVEVGRLDEEREGEDLKVYVFPAGETSDDLILRVVNQGDYTVKIVKIWINDNSYLEENFIVQPMGAHEKILVDYFDPDSSMYYFITVTTDRGNVFSSDSGSIQYIGDGKWDGGMFMINVLISYPSAGWFEIEISYDTDPPSTPFEYYLMHKSSAGTAFEFFTVTEPETYRVVITRKDMDVIYDDSVTIDWPYGPPVAWVFA